MMWRAGRLELLSRCEDLHKTRKGPFLSSTEAARSSIIIPAEKPEAPPPPLLFVPAAV